MTLDLKELLLKLTQTTLIGEIKMFAGTTGLPAGWLWCDGAEVSKTDYSKLYAVIGDTYNGSGTISEEYFKLPNFCGRVPVGDGLGDATGATEHTLGQTGGNENLVVPYHTHTIPNHSHTLARGQYGNAKIEWISYSSGSSTKSSTAGISGGGGGACSYAGTSGNATGANMMPYLCVSYIIYAGTS